MKNVKTCLVLAGLMALAGFSVRAQEKTYLELPAPRKEGGMPLMDALARRRSLREYAPDPLSDQTLSSLLWAAIGENRPGGYRTVPSARNWKGIDVYVAREDGLFLYQPEKHRLLKKKAGDLRPHAGRQAFVATAPVVLIYVADHARMADAPPDMVKFYSATDTGFISQNVYLFCAANDLATVVVGSFDKAKLGEAMGLSESEHVILTQPVAHPKGKAPVPADEGRAAGDGA